MTDLESNINSNINDTEFDRKLNSLRYLTKNEMYEICNLFKLPFNGIDFVLDEANKNIERIALDNLEDIMIYSDQFEEFKQHLKNKFDNSIIEANSPEGLLCSDAIGQQAMQSVLNTFHNVGSTKSNGPDSIRENISITKKRKAEYSVMRFKDPFLKYKDVMLMKKEYIGASIDFLLKEKPQTKVVYLPDQLKNDIRQQSSQDDIKKILKGKTFWWYIYTNFSSIFDMSTVESHRRTCIRLEFDVQKLFEFNLTTVEISTFLNTWVFKVTQPKKSNEGNSADNSSGEGTKRKTMNHGLFSVPSPNFLGIVDVYMKNISPETDHILLSLIHKNDFEKMFISGIEGITNFYPINTSITRLLKNVCSTSREDEEMGIKGSWLYLDNNRFNALSYHKVIDILKKADINFVYPSYGTPLQTNDGTIYTSLPFEFHSHKIKKELRKTFILRAYTYDSFNEHKEYSYIMPKIVNGQYSNQLEYVTPKNNFYRYERIDQGKDYIFLSHSQNEQKFDNIPLFNNRFKSKDNLNNFLQKNMFSYTEQYIVNNFFSGLDPSFLQQYMNFFEYDGIKKIFVGFEVMENGKLIYHYYIIFKHDYIDYKITTNLDYINSHLITQPLNSVLDQQFKIPENIMKKEEFYNPILCNYKIKNIEYIPSPRRRILLKSKKYLTDRYDFLGEDDIEKKKKDKETKMDPLSRLIHYISQEVNESELEYVYAETSGTNLSTLLTDKSINNSFTYCNNFEQTFKILGVEGGGRLLTLDMIRMVNNSGYINVSHINQLTNATTHSGINPMTSIGISCQNRGLHDMMSFDNAGNFILSESFKSKEQTTNNISSSLFTGNLMEMGTAGTKIVLNRMNIMVNNGKYGISEGFLNLGEVKQMSHNLYLPDTSEKTIFIPPPEFKKFPTVEFIMKNFVNRDLIFYILRGVNKEKNTVFCYLNIIKPKKDNLKISHLLKKVTRYVGIYDR